MMLRWLLLLGCTPSPAPEGPSPSPVPPSVADTDVDDTDVGDTDIADTDPPGIDSGTAGGLVGTLPDTVLPLPSFAATNFDGTSRGPDALQGHITVMWFLPAANTGG